MNDSYDNIKNLRTIVVSVEELSRTIKYVSSRMADRKLVDFLAEKVVLAELMNVPTHGLHYFIHCLYPLLLQNKINHGKISIERSSVYCDGTGGIGFLKLDEVLDVASELAVKYGIALALIKDPGKVGALRVYCEKYMNNNQLVMIFKNTARTVGVQSTKEPIIGTNPICIGLPGTNFIYDSSISTVATNKVRLAEKYGYCFPYPIGVSKDMELTSQPEKITTPEGFLLPFSYGPFWYKSFHLGVVIEALAAFAGGKTGRRVGEHKGKRLYSKEGLFAIVVDGSASPVYKEYIEEINNILSEITDYGIRIPNDYEGLKENIELLKDDWEELINL